MVRLIKYVFFAFISAGSLFSQDSGLSGIIETEKWLQEAFTELYNPGLKIKKDSLNYEILARFEKALQTEEGFFYPWGKLDMIGKVKSEDGKVRLFTWYLEKNGKEYKYFGILQVFNGKKDKVVVFFLDDKSEEMKNPETLDLNPETWYGALYYGIHTYTYKRKTYYVLLAYDFNGMFSDKKLIEVLSLEKKDNPVFGHIFQMEFQKLKRVIYEYSAQVIMTIRYDERLKMIVFDHLSPIEPIFTNNYNFYSPDGSYDGFEFEKGIFKLRTDVDARNY